MKRNGTEVESKTEVENSTLRLKPIHTLAGADEPSPLTR